MVTSHTIELALGASVRKDGSSWVIDLGDGRVLPAKGNVRFALLLLEREPTHEFMAMLDGFPLLDLAKAALLSGNPRWIDFGVTWVEALGAAGELQSVLGDALPMLPKSAQRTRQKVHTLLTAAAR